jgi:uncharacterized protein (TIGR02118 family)
LVLQTSGESELLQTAQAAREKTRTRQMKFFMAVIRAILAFTVLRLYKGILRQTRRHGMIKVSVMYPNTPGGRFNHEYYRDTHMPLVKSRMGESCKYYTVDKGLAGGAPGAPPTYVGMCHIFCDSVETFQAGFGPHAKEIMADIPNYTDQAPVIQISEVVVG